MCRPNCIVIFQINLYFSEKCKNPGLGKFLFVLVLDIMLFEFFSECKIFSKASLRFKHKTN